MPTKVHSEHLHKVEAAAAHLEYFEIEYSLETLTDKSGLDVSDVLEILKQHWIKDDNLNIFHLNLSKSEELHLYS